MGRAKDINAPKRAEVSTLLKNTSLSMREIARRTCISASSVSKIKKFINEPEETIHHRSNSGRKRATSTRTDAVITRSARKSPWISATQQANELHSHGIEISDRTVRRRLNEAGFKSVRPIRKPLLTSAMKRKRLIWAKNHRHWTVEDWRKVSFILNINYLLLITNILSKNN